VSIGSAAIGVAAIGASAGPAPGPPVDAWWERVTSQDRVTYRLVLSKDSQDDLVVPMSSWQSTVQTGAQSYLQAVIPAAVDRYADVLAMSGGTISVYRVVSFAADGSEQSQLMASSPLQTIRYDRGATNASVTISGYWTEEAADAAVVTLHGVRTISITSTVRARTSIDWTLRPGQTAHAADQTIDPVRYINYYVSVDDEYMDVGA
jgi:hypothetical protein